MAFCKKKIWKSNFQVFPLKISTSVLAIHAKMVHHVLTELMDMSVHVQRVTLEFIVNKVSNCGGEIICRTRAS